MRQSHDATAEAARLGNALFIVIFGYGIMGAALGLAKRGLGVAGSSDNLMLATSFLIALTGGGLALCLNSKKARQVVVVETPEKTEWRRRLGRRTLTAVTVAYIFLCVFNSATAWEMVRNPALGWGYKVCLVAAVNVFAYTLSRAVPLILPRFKNARKPSRPLAPQSATSTTAAAGTAAPAFAPVDTNPAVATDTAAPLTAGRSR